MSAAGLEVVDLALSRGPEADAFRVELPRLTVAPGEIAVLAGASGSGKSTLLDLLGLLTVPDRVGRLAIGGEDAAPALRAGRLEALAPLRRRQGHVLQTGGLLPFLTVADNIRLTQPTDRPPPLPLEALAERLGLGGLLRRKPGTLSVGQRQRAAIARALMGDPAVLLADEPTAALDPPTAEAVLALLQEICRERGTAVVMASHAWGLVRRFGLTVLAARPVVVGGRPAIRFDPGPAEGLAA